MTPPPPPPPPLPGGPRGPRPDPESLAPLGRWAADDSVADTWSRPRLPADRDPAPAPPAIPPARPGAPRPRSEWASGLGSNGSVKMLAAGFDSLTPSNSRAATLPPRRPTPPPPAPRPEGPTTESSAPTFGDAPESLDSTDWRGLVDAVCDAYEDAWRERAADPAAPPPRIEDFLRSFQGPPAKRRDLLRELLTLECELRAQAGERPRPGDYLPRFPAPELRAVVEEFFADPEFQTDLDRDRDPIRGDGPRDPVSVRDRNRERDRDRDRNRGSVSPRLRAASAVRHPRARPRAAASLDPADRTGAGGGAIERFGRGAPSPPAAGRQHGLDTPEPRRHAHARADGWERRHNVLVKRHPLRDIPVDVLARVERLVQHECPHLARCLSVEKRGAELVVVTEAVEGPTLLDLRKREAPEIRLALRIVDQLARALETLHDLGLTHGKLNPAQIVMREDRSPVVVDFGDSLAPGARARSVLSGPHGFQAPEQARGLTHKIEPTTDVFRLAAVLYWLVTGSAPFEREGPVSSWDRSRIGVVRRPREINPRLPRGVERVLLRALDDNPARRFPTVAAFREALAHEASRPVGAMIGLAVAGALLGVFPLLAWVGGALGDGSPFARSPDAAARPLDAPSFARARLRVVRRPGASKPARDLLEPGGRGEPIAPGEILDVRWPRLDELADDVPAVAILVPDAGAPRVLRVQPPRAGDPNNPSPTGLRLVAVADRKGETPAPRPAAGSEIPGAADLDLDLDLDLARVLDDRLSGPPSPIDVDPDFDPESSPIRWETVAIVVGRPGDPPARLREATLRAALEYADEADEADADRNNPETESAPATARALRPAVIRLVRENPDEPAILEATARLEPPAVAFAARRESEAAAPPRAVPIDHPALRRLDERLRDRVRELVVVRVALRPGTRLVPEPAAADSGSESESESESESRPAPTPLAAPSPSRRSSIAADLAIAHPVREGGERP